MANLQFYLDNFRCEMQSGKDARLHMECHAGQVWLSFHVHVAPPPPKQHHQRHHGTSRLRRRARRAEARAAAAANAVPKETVADDVDTAAEQSETNKHNDDLPISFTAAEEAVQHPQTSDTQLPAEQAVHWDIRTPDVPDTFCPDRDYEAAGEVGRPNVHSPHSHNHNIPQLDGLTDDCANSPAG